MSSTKIQILISKRFLWAANDGPQSDENSSRRASAIFLDVGCKVSQGETLCSQMIPLRPSLTS